MISSGAPATTQVVLFRSKDDAVAAVVQGVTMGQVGSMVGTALSGLSGSAYAMTIREVAQVAAKLSDLSIADVIVAGWQKYSVLVEAARRTVLAPGTEELVEIVGHRISGVHQPSIDLIVNGACVMTVHLELELSIDIKAFVAVIRHGRVVAINCGQADIQVKLAIEGATIKKGVTQLNIGLLLPLGNGIPLLSSAQLSAQDTRQTIMTSRSPHIRR